MNSIESDGDLLAACRTRARLLHDIELADHDLALAEFMAARARCERDPDVSTAAERKLVLQTSLADVNDAIAEAVMEHLLCLPVVPPPLMVLPRVSRR